MFEYKIHTNCTCKNTINDCRFKTVDNKEWEVERVLSFKHYDTIVSEGYLIDFFDTPPLLWAFCGQTVVYPRIPILACTCLFFDDFIGNYLNGK